MHFVFFQGMHALYNRFFGGEVEETPKVECWDIGEIGDIDICYKEFYDMPCANLGLFLNKETCEDFRRGDITTKRSLTPEELLKSIDNTKK